MMKEIINYWITENLGHYADRDLLNFVKRHILNDEHIRLFNTATKFPTYYMVNDGLAYGHITSKQRYIISVAIYKTAEELFNLKR